MDEHFFRGTTVEVKTPTLQSQEVPLNSSFVEEVILMFRVQVKYLIFEVAEDQTITMVGQHKSRKISIMSCQLPVYIFNHIDGALQQYLSSQLETYGNTIDVKTIADEIINRWIEIREENLNIFRKVFPLKVTLKFWNDVMLYERPSTTESVDGMVPASNIAIEEMLKKVEIEEMDGDQSCVICLEEMGKEEKNAILQMPCLHVFHEECIKKWLKKSHTCPICRFQIPTN